LQQKILQAGLDVDSWCLFRRADQFGKGWGDIGHPDGRSGAQWAEDVRTEWEAVNQRFRDLQCAKLTVKDLALDGHALMELAGRPPGPWLGRLQAWLLEKVLDDPDLNTPDDLRALVRDRPSDQR
jgi:tRNA nucleotidyltransferase (CCA-adding enzyme)